MPTDLDLPTLDLLHAEASAGPWRAGRSDMTSYDGNTGEAFKNVYGPEHEKHPRTGADIPLTVARGESERCHANATWIATIHNTWPTISARLKELESNPGLRAGGAIESEAVAELRARVDELEIMDKFYGELLEKRGDRIDLLEETLRGILQEKQTERHFVSGPGVVEHMKREALDKQIAWLERVLRGDQ